MKKYYLLFTIYCLLFTVTHGQNLVSNGSFTVNSLSELNIAVGEITFSSIGILLPYCSFILSVINNLSLFYPSVLFLVSDYFQVAGCT